MSLISTQIHPNEEALVGFLIIAAMGIGGLFVVAKTIGLFGSTPKDHKERGSKVVQKPKVKKEQHRLNQTEDRKI